MVHVEAITKPRNTSCDLVELDALLAAIYEEGVSMGRDNGIVMKGGVVNIPRFLTYIMSDVWGRR